MLKASEVEITPFVLKDFATSETEHICLEPVGKKELKRLAKKFGLAYDDKHIAFAKNLINVYIKKR